MVRLDKFLCDCNMGTRSQIKDYIRQGLVSVNGIVVKKPELKIQEDIDNVALRGESCTFKKYAYYMLHKPAGVVSATTDNTADTVFSLLTDVKDKNLFPVGRLDKDTTGLLLITNDGDLSHRMLSPKKHVDKLYHAHVDGKVDEADVAALAQGLVLEDGLHCLPAGLEPIGDGSQCLVTLREGKYHQVKRMLASRGKPVTALKRLSMGSLVLDEALLPGEWRFLTKEETAQLKSGVCAE